MKKPYKFNQLSDKACVACGKKLKKNVVDRKPSADLCYSCHKKDRRAKQKAKDRAMMSTSHIF